MPPARRTRTGVARCVRLRWSRGQLLGGARTEGGQLRWFNPMRLLRLSFRNHRKLLVTDGATAIVGGLNLADEYDGDGVNKGWRDLALEPRGPVVEALSDSFSRMWALAAFDRPAAGFRPSASVLGTRPIQTRAAPGGPGVSHHRLASTIVCRPARGLSRDRPCGLFCAFAGAASHADGYGAAGRGPILMPASSDVPVALLATWHVIRRIGVPQSNSSSICRR